jgi:hypothetical protein
MSGEISRRLQQLEKALDPTKLASEAYDVFRGVTPIKSGNARSSTSLKGDEIHASYPYAAVLDKGRHMTSSGMRGSVQAPNGMTKPTQKFVSDYIRKQKKG